MALTKSVGGIGGGSGSLEVQEESATTTAAASVMNFVGAGVTATDVAGVATVTIPGGGAPDVKEEGSTAQAAASVLNFVGPVLTATSDGSGGAIITALGNPNYGGDDTPLTSPNVADDEFSTGSSIDTAGSRFASATAWAWRNQGSATSTVANGSLFLTSSAASGTIHFVEQALAAGTFIYEVRFLGCWALANSWGHSGIFLLNTGGTVPSLCFGPARGDEGNPLQVARFNNTTFSAARINPRSHIGQNTGFYMRIERTATPTLIFSVSRNKRRWFTAYSIPEGTDFASAANKIGLFMISSGASTEAEFENFRRIA